MHKHFCFNNWVIKERRLIMRSIIFGTNNYHNCKTVTLVILSHEQKGVYRNA